MENLHCLSGASPQPWLSRSSSEIMEWEYPESCEGPTPLNPHVLPSHALRAVLTLGGVMGEGIFPDSHLASSSIQGLVLQKWDLPQKCGSTPKPTWDPPPSHLDVLLCYSLPALGSASPRFCYFSIYLWLYFWKGFCSLLEPGCSQLLLFQPLDLGVG